MLFLAIVAVIGFTRKQPSRYWFHAAAALAIQLTATALFAGGGTLEDPTGDGLLTRIVRQAANDGPAVALMILPALLVGWGIPIYLVKRGYVRREQFPAPVAP